MTMTVIPIPGTGTCVGGVCQPPAIRYVAVNSAILSSDNILLCQQVAPLTLVLPLAASVPDQWFVIKDFDGDALANNIDVSTSGADQIELPAGAGLGAAYTMDANFESVTLYSDGVGRYFII